MQTALKKRMPALPDANRRRSGFTLVELLVVIAIIGILVALLLPAVQAAREAARRMQCTNNLKQIGLALHNYHDVLRSFPPGWIRPPQRGNFENWGWSVFILPYIEQENLYNQLNPARFRLQDVLAQGPTVAAPLQLGIPVYNCPTDSGADPQLAHVNRHFGGGVGTVAGGLGNYRTGRTNYVGVMGNRDAPGRADHLSNGMNGIFFYNSRIGFQDIIDGTSNTFMVGERDTMFCRAGSWVGVRNPRGGGSRGVYTVIGHSDRDTRLNSPDPPFRWSSGSGCGEGFSSLHSGGGANFLFADGSVHWVSETIEFNKVGRNAGNNNTRLMGAYQRLNRRNDRQPVTLN